MFCSDSVILSKYEPGIKVDPLPCNRWSCQECYPKRKARLRSEACRGRPNAFITLTVNPQTGTSPDDRARSLVDAWRKVRRKAKKKWGNVRIPFLSVFEETKKDEPHLHILCRLKWIPQQWLSDEMRAEIGAPIVDIRRVNSRKKAAAYVTKYIGKSPTRFEGCKRYWRSLDWFVEPRKEYQDPVGIRERRWWEQGKLPDVLKKYSKRFYRIETYQVGDKEESWLVDDIPDWSVKETCAQTSLF